ncbi:MAG: hypothetical protein KA004_05995 [Verrucomicrobiales bacterium]|nr:hypothetical protein [Verrucomicrobiales bacterium]
MKFALFPLFALVLAALPTSRAEEKTYTVKLEREDHKGQKTKEKITASNAQAQTVTVGGKVVQEQNETLSGTLTGVREVLEINEKKKATKFKFAVEKLTVKKGEEDAQELLSGGTVMVVQRKKDGQMSFTVEGEEADEDTKKVLDIMFELPKEKEPEVGDDEAFGTNEPRKPGTEWDLDMEKLLKSMPEDMPFQVDVAGSSGKMNFAGVKEVDGTECCQMKADVKLKVKGMKGMPAEMKSTKAGVRLTIDGLLPTDNALPEFASTMTMNLEFAGSITGPDGNPALIKVKVDTKKSSETRPAE